VKNFISVLKKNAFSPRKFYFFKIKIGIFYKNYKVPTALQHLHRALITTISNVKAGLFTWLKQNWLSWRTGFYPASQTNLKSF